MTTATMLFATLLSPEEIDDDRFFEATALLSTRFGGEPGDIRADDEAPQIVFDWLRHAARRVPDLRVWALSCRIETFLDPASGNTLPGAWRWDTRDRLLALNASLRAHPDWVPAFEAAADEANDAIRRWLDCLYLDCLYLEV